MTVDPRRLKQKSISLDVRDNAFWGGGLPGNNLCVGEVPAPRPDQRNLRNSRRRFHAIGSLFVLSSSTWSPLLYSSIIRFF